MFFFSTYTYPITLRHVKFEKMSFIYLVLLKIKIK